MGIKSKICPSCKEKNNPTFTKCWKCGIDFAPGRMSAQPQKTDEDVRRSKKVELASRSYFKKGVILQWIGSLISVSIFFIPKHTLVIFLFGVITFVIGLFLEISSHGNVAFWTKVKDYPDMAYDWFKSHPSWAILDESKRGVENLFSKKEWIGPFRLAVPKLGGRTVKILGRRSDIDQAELEFLAKIEVIEN